MILGVVYKDLRLLVESDGFLYLLLNYLWLFLYLQYLNSFIDLLNLFRLLLLDRNHNNWLLFNYRDEAYT